MDKIEKLGKKKIIIISLIVIVVMAALGTTLAFFIWTGDESTITVTVSSGTGSCTLASDDNKKLIPTDSRNKGRIIKLNATQEIASKASITWNIVINDINLLADRTFKYEMINSSTNTSYGNGTFENVSDGNVITLSSNEVLDKGKNYEFTLYLWIDGTEADNPITMAKQDYDFDINCQIIGVDG